MLCIRCSVSCIGDVCALLFVVLFVLIRFVCVLLCALNLRCLCCCIVCCYHVFVVCSLVRFLIWCCRMCVCIVHV